MINSVIFCFNYIFNTKVKMLVLVYFIALSLFQVIRLKQIFFAYGIHGGLIDYLLFTIGGLESPTTFTFIISWISTTFMILYISTLVVDSLDKLTVLSLNRVKSRLSFWLVTCINQLLVSISLFILLIIVLFICGVISFNLNINPSEYTELFYNSWCEYSLIHLISLISLIFTSGIYALQMIMQVSLLCFKNKVSIFISYLMISVTMGILHLYGKIPRIFSPIFYSSTLSLSKNDVNNALLLNILVSLVAIIIGYLIFRKKDL